MPEDVPLGTLLRRYRRAAGMMLEDLAEALEHIPPDAERQFAGRMGAATLEIAAGHVAMVSHPDAATELIRTAAAAVAA